MFSRKEVLLSVIIGSIFVGPSLWAFDWKAIHAQADALTASKDSIRVSEDERREDVLYKAGLVYLNVHRDNEAKQLFEKIRTLTPANIPAQWGIAEVLRRQHRIEESRKQLEKIIAEDPAFVPALISLAYIKYQTFDFMGAVNLGVKAIVLGPDKMDTANLARAYLITAGAKGMVAHYGGPISKLVHGTKVYALLKKAERLQPDTAQVMFGLGAFYVLAPSIIGGDLTVAEKYLKRAIELDPLLVDAYVRLAQVYKRQKDEQKFKEYIQKALQIDPQSELALDIQSNTCKYICFPAE